MKLYIGIYFKLYKAIYEYECLKRINYTNNTRIQQNDGFVFERYNGVSMCAR